METALTVLQIIVYIMAIPVLYLLYKCLQFRVRVQSAAVNSFLSYDEWKKQLDEEDIQKDEGAKDE